MRTHPLTQWHHAAHCMLPIADCRLPNAPEEPMEIRQLTGLEQQQALYIWSQSFERGDRKMEDWKEWEERTPTGRTTYGVFDSSGLQASFLLVDEEIHLGAEIVLPMSAVCGVGVLPSSRGKGYAS